MVMFFYVGGGPRSILLSLGVTFLVSLLQGGTQLPFFSGSPFFLSWPEADFDYDWHTGWPEEHAHSRPGRRQSRGRPRSRRGRGERPAAEPTEPWDEVVSHPRQQWLSATAAKLVRLLLGATLVLAAFGWALLQRPHWAANRPLRAYLRLSRWARERLERLARQFGATLQQAAGGESARPRPCASRQEISRLPVESFLSEDDLLKWSPTKLKDELRRLQVLADLRLGMFSGGSSARETHHLLRAGGAVEKQELVQAILKARGGESGVSCAVCLAAYESGDELRVMPCGHRFHCACVDRWLAEQSRTCPLCSKPV